MQEAKRDTHRLLSEFVVERFQTLVGIIKLPLSLLWKDKTEYDYKSNDSINEIILIVLPIRQTHRVGSYSQALLNEPLKCGLQDQVLIRDGLLHDLLSRDGLQRLKRFDENEDFVVFMFTQHTGISTWSQRTFVL